MEDLKAVNRQWALREILRVIVVLRSQFPLRPDGGGPSRRVEPFQVFKAHASAIVISADDAMHVGASPVEHRVRVRSIAYKVAATQDQVVAPLRRFECGF